MSIFNNLFRKSNRSSRKDNDLNEEIEMIRNREYEIVSIIPQEDNTLVLYRYFHDSISKDQGRTIFLGTRVIPIRGDSFEGPILEAFFDQDFSTISLNDIKMKNQPPNQGYGSVLLANLIDIAKKRNVNCITGSLSDNDKDHVDRLKHFYKKHNFEVIQYGDTKDGWKIGEIIWENN